VNLIEQAAALLVLCWLPGAMLFRAPLLDRQRRAALDADERVFWAVLLSLAVSLSITLALAAAGAYSFARLLVADVVLAAALAVYSRNDWRVPEAKRVTVTAAIPLVLLALGAWRFFPPAEYVIGGKDPGVYMNEGIQIAQRGALVVEETVVASVPPFARTLFLPRHTDLHGNPRSDYYSGRFMGFFIQDPETGAVVGQFPHLYPASIAVGYGIDGLTGARRVTGAWALLGVLAVYFAGRRAFGTATAAAAAGLLTIHVLQLWFARYPNAEVVMQTMLFAGVLAYARGHVDGMRFFAPVAGGLLGLLLFLRLDTGLAIVAVGVAAALGILVGRSPRRSFWAALIVPLFFAAVYMLGPMRAHWERYRIFLETLAIWQYVLGIGIGVALLALLAFSRRIPRLDAWTTRLSPTVIATLGAFAALYALYLREPGGRLAAHDAYALRTFANVYLTVPGVLAAILGFFLLARRHFWHAPALFLTFAAFSFTLFYKIRIVPEHFWMGRRFLAVILPGALLMIAGLAFATATSGPRWRILRWAAGGTLLVLLASTYLRTSAPVLDHVEYEGLIPRLEALAGHFGENDLVIMESRNAGGDVHVLATPLAYIYDRNVLLLVSPRPDKVTMAEFVAWARTKYDRVFYVGGGGTDLLSHNYGFEAVASERFQVPEFETTTAALPRLVSHKEFEYSVYEIVEPRPRFEDEWFDLDLGIADDLHVLRFHAKEQTDGRTFRWTTATSYVAVTTVPATASELTLVLHDGGRPPAAPPASVAVYLANTRLGQIDLVPGGFRAYALTVPAEVAERAARATDPVELRLVSTVWNPSEVIGAPDNRVLGVMVDRVTLR
jgi:hypothetical protein